MECPLRTGMLKSAPKWKDVGLTVTCRVLKYLLEILNWALDSFLSLLGVANGVNPLLGAIRSILFEASFSCSDIASTRDSWMSSGRLLRIPQSTIQLDGSGCCSSCMWRPWICRRREDWRDRTHGRTIVTLTFSFFRAVAYDIYYTLKIPSPCP